MRLWMKIAIGIVVAEVLGSLGGWITVQSLGSWYARLEQPPGTPPNWVFGPVWTTLYAMIGTSAGLLWHHAPAGRAKRRAFTWFTLQAIWNLLWTPVFFGAHRPGLALVIIVLLVLCIAVTLRQFLAQHRLAGWLLAPYLLWTCYATYLNAGIFLLNR